MRRRTFLKGAAAGLGLAATNASSARAGANLATKALAALGVGTAPTHTPVKHLVVVMMENRSADHYLGWYGAENPAFDAKQHASFPDLRVGPAGPQVPTRDWGQAGLNNFHGRGFEDPSHGWTGGRLERNGGACDGWLHPGTGNDELALSYYDGADVPVWAQLARGYQAYDRWFCSLLGPTQPNRYYLHSAQSGGLKNNDLPPQLAATHPEWRTGWNWPTIWTLLETYGISCAYYFSNLPELAFWGGRHLRNARHISEYYAAATAGQLPQVSFIDPWFSTPSGLANDDHPLADIRLGQSFLSDVTEAFVKSKNYRDGALILTYDEWGGFWDHVNPPRVADDRATDGDPAGDNDFGQVGFRIPSTIVSPWTRRAGAVDHNTYEHASILRFISDNWNLPYLTRRQASTNSIENAFGGFATYEAEASFVPYEAPLGLLLEPTLDGELPSSPLSVASPPSVASASEGSDLHRLADIGWFDKLPVRTDWRFEDSFMKSRPALLAEARAALTPASTR
jgi:phospholipase C